MENKLKPCVCGSTLVDVEQFCGGPSAFARKAIEEAQKGNTSVFVLPLPWNIALLMEAGAEVRYGGKWRWLEADSKEPGPARAQGIFILRGKI